MRKNLKVLAVFLASFLVTAAANAAPDDIVGGMFDKARRGFIDVCTGWVELPAQIIKGYNEGFKDDESRKVLGTAEGIVDGVTHSAGRTLSGLRELAGFWTANPADSEGVGIPLDSEYAWEKGEPHSCFDPNVTEAAIKPIGAKLARGLVDTLFGVVELPGQMMKGTSEGALDLGITKGLWYWISREWNGINDLATALLPGHPDEKGMAFDEEWPWDAFKMSAR